jgi:hypothetical protein
MDTRVDEGLIQWRCQRRDHYTPDTRTSPVFLHGGHWAYCEAGKLSPDHEFVATGGLRRPRIETLKTEAHS